MLRELFRIPGMDWPVYSYGVLLVIGTLCAIYLAKLLARRRGIDPEIFVNAGLLALLSGVVGARLSHVIENWGHYTRAGVPALQLIGEAINIRSGGLTYYGGFLLATPVLIWYGIKHRINVRVGMDIAAPCLMVGLAFGRIGCFLNGCCYGEQWNGPCAVSFPYYSDAYIDQANRGEIRPPNELVVPGSDRLIPPEIARRDPELARIVADQHARPVHPTQLYSALTGFLLAAMLLAYMPLSRAPGTVFALMLTIEPVTRFLLESLRVEPAVYGGMSLSQLLAIPQFVVGVAMWVGFGMYARRKCVAEEAAAQ